MVQLQDGCSQYIVFQGSFRRFSVQPRIKCASGYLEDPAHPLNSKFDLMVFHEPEYLLSLKDKMLTAFFRLSHSTCAYLRALFNREIFRCSGVITGIPFPAKLPSPFASYTRHQRHKGSVAILRSGAISPVDLPLLWSSTTINLKALSNFFLVLTFLDSKLRGLTYCPIFCSRFTALLMYVFRL